MTTPPPDPPQGQPQGQPQSDPLSLQKPSGAQYPPQYGSPQPPPPQYGTPQRPPYGAVPQYPPPPYGSAPYASAPPAYPGYPSAPVRLGGRIPLRLALVFGVIGVALLVVGGIVGFSQGLNKVDSFQRVSPADGIRTVHLNAGDYVAYYEAPNYDTNSKTVPILVLQILDPSTGHLLTGSLYGGRSDHKVEILTYDYDGHHGAALYQFRVPHNGTYQVRVVRPPASTAAPNSDIAIGHSIATGLAVGGVLAVVGGIAIVLALILLIVGLVQRRSSKKRLGAAQAYGGHSAPYGYPQG